MTHLPLNKLLYQCDVVIMTDLGYNPGPESSSDARRLLTTGLRLGEGSLPKESQGIISEGEWMLGW